MDAQKKDQPEASSSKKGIPEPSGPIQMAEVSLRESPLDIGERDLLVSGGCASGSEVKGRGSCSFQGDISGSPTHPCVIEVGGDVMVGGNLNGARVRCRSLRVGGDMGQAVIASDRGVEVGGNLKSSELQLGACATEYEEYQLVCRSLSRLEAERNGHDGRIRMASRRFQRDYAAIDLQFANIIGKSPRGVDVNLNDLYRIMEGRSEHAIDTAIESFYLKVVVGALTRTNRAYLSQNPNRQTVFLRLVAELREHFLEVRSRDKVQLQLKRCEERRDRLIQDLTTPSKWTLSVWGRLESGSVVRFVQYRAPSSQIETEASLERRVAQFRMVEGEGDQVGLLLSSAEGTSLPKKTLSASELHGIRLHLKQGMPAWEPLGS